LFLLAFHAVLQNVNHNFFKKEKEKNNPPFCHRDAASELLTVYICDMLMYIICGFFESLSSYIQQAMDVGLWRHECYNLNGWNLHTLTA